MLRPFKLVNGFTAIAIDGSGQVESTKVHCDRCLVQEKEDGVHYSHKVVLADALQSTGPMVKRFQAHDMDFIVKVKEPGHTTLFDAAFDSPRL